MQFDQLKIHPVISDNQTSRLNFISGRYLSEQEFDLMQQYVDERCEDLLLTMHPGIVQGLDVTHHQDQMDLPIQVDPGLGVSWSGRAIGTRFPIRFRWNDLRRNYRAEQGIEGTMTDGYYFLTLRRGVVIVDEEQQADPCVRTEPDPLRDSRLETMAQVNLQFIPMASTLMNASRQRACMRILKKMLTPQYFSMNSHEVKLAIIKIKNNEMLWLDAQSSRFLAQENSVYQTLQNYWHVILKSPGFRVDNTAPDLQEASSLNNVLGIDFLPASGRFPESLIENLAGKAVGVLWQRPRLKFNSDGLQIEILPVPANSVNGVIKEELNRGVVDLLNGEADRIRLMLAVNPNDYHPKLMDLPSIDMDLIDDLKSRRKVAVDAYVEWVKSFYSLYENLDEGTVFDAQEKPSKSTLDIFSNVYLVSSPKGAFSSINTDKKRKNLRVPPENEVPKFVWQMLNEIVATRVAKLQAGMAVPRPYALRNEIPNTQAADEQLLPELKSGSNGLFRQRVLIKQDIDEIENYIIRSNQVIDQLRDYISSQRQQLDSITVSFATLAGGIPGDGTGLKLMRWADRLTFTPKKATT